MKKMAYRSFGFIYVPFVIGFSFSINFFFFPKHNIGWFLIITPLCLVGFRIPNDDLKWGMNCFGFLSFITGIGLAVYFGFKKDVGKLMLILGFFSFGYLMLITGNLVDMLKRALGRDGYLTPKDAFTIITCFVVVLLFYTFLYVSLQLNNNKFLQILNPTLLFMDIFYFNVVTFTMLGNGDIVPLTVMAKSLITSENLISFFLFALGLGCIVKGIKQTQERT